MEKLNDVTKQLAKNIERKSLELMILSRSLEKMEFFRRCPNMESQKLKSLIDDICASSQVLQSSLNVVLH